jgi:glycosyltransferase involved in cell wall biosynthesis
VKILSYSHAYAGAGHNGGAETTLHDVMRHLHRWHTTDALVSEPHPDGSGPYVLDGVKVQPFGSKLDPQLYFSRYDLIIGHLSGALRGGAIARQLGVPNLHLIHNDQDYCITAAHKYADGLIFNSNWVVPHYPADIPGVIVHPIVEPERYRVDTSRQYITLINLTVGQTERLSYDKGGHTFYELARRFPNEKFLGVKGGYGDQFVPDDLPPNVTIWEHSNNVLNVYRQSKLILVPSRYESYGRVAVEASCSGIPSILTATDGTVEAMGDGATYCSYGDYDEWEKAVANVLGNYDYWCSAARERGAENWLRSQRQIEALRNFVGAWGGENGGSN